MNVLIIEFIREYDGDEYVILCLRHDPSKYSGLTRSNLSKIGVIVACVNDIDTDATDLVRKKSEVVWKVKLN